MTDLIERLRNTRLLSQRNQMDLQREAAAAIQSRDEEIARLLDILKRLRDFDGWDGTFHAGEAFEARRDGRAALEKRA